MTNLQRRIELLEDHGNHAELLSLLACDQDKRERNRRLADKLRLLAVALRNEALALAALAASVGGLFLWF